MHGVVAIEFRSFDVIHKHDVFSFLNHTIINVHKCTLLLPFATVYNTLLIVLVLSVCIESCFHCMYYIAAVSYIEFMYNYFHLQFYRLKFPQIILVYATISSTVIQILLVTAWAATGSKLFCSSRDYIKTLCNPTAFCSTIGQCVYDIMHAMNNMTMFACIQ